ncbi:MAG: cytochrome c oxidase subunit II [Sphingomonadales bacterium]
MSKRLILAAIAVLTAGIFQVDPTLASQPEPWQIGMQPAVTPIAGQMHNFHDLLLWIISAIVVFVLVLLLYVFVRFNAKANPTPAKTAHHTVLEVVWTVIPIMILLVIAVPSFRLLFAQDAAMDADLTVKAIGHQWYWTYEYPDHNLEFDALMVFEEDLKKGQPRLLETDNHLVVPVGAVVKLLVTASPEDVIHAWAVPAFGVKIDAVPGRLNETWFQAEREGTYYGQCSELCGVNHGYMPITVDVVSQDKYQAWLANAEREFAMDGADDPVKLAEALR